MEESNYAKFCGKKNDGIKKKQFCEVLAEKMNQISTTTRDAKSVLSKIQHVERTWRAAHNFATSATGEGIQEEDGVERFEELIRKKCPYYYDLLEVMQDRASSKPKATSYELENSLLDEDEDEDEEVNAADDDPDDISAISKESGAVSASASAAASVATSRASQSSKRQVGSRKNDSSAQKKKARPTTTKKSFMDEDTLSVLNEANKAAAIRVSELERHNKALEEIEQQRYELEKKRDEREILRLDLEKSKLETMSWKGKSDQLDYKMKLLSRYHDIKNKYNWSDEQIIGYCPEMKDVIEARPKTAEDD